MDGICKLADFQTVEEFWQYWNHIPLPSKFFTRQQKFVDRDVEAFSIFRSGIEPKWEDEKNSAGGEFYFRDSIELSMLDKYWEETVLALIGETLDPDTNQLCGVRVVDKTRNNRGKVNPSFRLELWFANNDEDMKKEIKSRFENTLETACGGSGIPTIEYRAHSF